MSTKLFNNTPSNSLFEKLKGIAAGMNGFRPPFFFAVVGYFRLSRYFKMRAELASIYRVHMVKYPESSFSVFKKSLATLQRITVDMIRIFAENKVSTAPASMSKA